MKGKQEDQKNKPLERTASVCLAREKEKVINGWEERVRRELPAASHQRRPALLDSLPSLLERLIRALSPSNLKRDPYIEDLSKQHARERASFAAYTIEQVIREYQYLRESIIGVLEPEATLSKIERDIIHHVVDEGLAEAAKEYTKYCLSLSITI